MTSTNDYESVLHDLFAIEEATTPVGVTGSGSDKTDKKQWKDYPSEKPRKDELVAWIEGWSDDLLASAGIAHTSKPRNLSRGSLPRSALRAPFSALRPQNP